MRGILIAFFVLALCQTSSAGEFVKNGVQKEYYSNGKLHFEVTYRNGKKNGLEREYGKDGLLKYETLFEGGDKQDWKWYYKDGKIYDHVTYSKDGVRHGMIYYISGQIKSDFEWDNNVMYSSKEYYPTGRLSEEKHRNKKGPSIEIAYDEKGNVITEGVINVYNFLGSVAGELHFKKGNRNGVYMANMIDGDMFLEQEHCGCKDASKVKAMYKDGEMIKVSYYDKEGGLITSHNSGYVDF